MTRLTVRERLARIANQAGVAPSPPRLTVCERVARIASYSQKLTFDVPRNPREDLMGVTSDKEMREAVWQALCERDQKLATTPMRVTTREQLQGVLEGLYEFLEDCDEKIEEERRFKFERIEGRFQWLYQYEVTRALCGLLASPYFLGTAAQRLAVLAEIDLTDREQFHLCDHVPDLVRSVLESVA